MSVNHEVCLSACTNLILYHTILKPQLCFYFPTQETFFSLFSSTFHFPHINQNIFRPCTLISFSNHIFHSLTFSFHLFLFHLQTPCPYQKWLILFPPTSCFFQFLLHHARPTFTSDLSCFSIFILHLEITMLRRQFCKVLFLLDVKSDMVPILWNMLQTDFL